MNKNRKMTRVKITHWPTGQKISMIMGVLIFGTIGTYLLVQSHADVATPVPALSETFSGSQVTNTWITNGASVPAGNPQVCLTAGNGTGNGSDGTIPGCTTHTDSPGHGALRLTDNLGGQSGIVINKTPIQLNKGYHITFDMYQYDYPYAGQPTCPYPQTANDFSTCMGGDGISFFLVDSAKDPTVSALSYAGGELLGYKFQNGGVGGSGIHGGYVGVGFDELGNWSRGPDNVAKPNSIAVRGSEDSNYAYVTGVQEHANLIATDSATSRTANDVRHVEIDISNTHQMAVLISYGNGPLVAEIPDIDLSAVNGSQALPSSMFVGFGSGQSGTTAYHEINNLVVQELTPGNGGGLIGITGTGAGSGAGTGTGSGTGAGGTTGTGNGSAGTGTGTTAGKGAATGTTTTATSPAPSSTVTTSPAAATQTTSPTGQTATDTTSTIKAPSGATQQSTQPNKAPTVSAQGTQTPPPPAKPSPFYDGQQYSPGSESDITLGSTFKNTSQTLLTHWYYDVGGVILLAGLVVGGVYVGRKKPQKTKKTAPKKSPKKAA